MNSSEGTLKEELTGLRYDTGEVDYWDRTYRRFRSQVEHENSLYNQRILWLIYIQALLFATVGLLMRARYVEQGEQTVTAVYLIIFVVGCLGTLIGRISSRLLDNARTALDELRELWSDIVIHDLPSHLHYHFPHISGGSGAIRVLKSNEHPMDNNQAKTKLRSGHLPFIFSVAWPIIIVILVSDWLFLNDYLNWQVVGKLIK